jgi:hypothetical protein
VIPCSYFYIHGLPPCKMRFESVAHFIDTDFADIDRCHRCRESVALLLTVMCACVPCFFIFILPCTHVPKFSPCFASSRSRVRCIYNEVGNSRRRRIENFSLQLHHLLHAATHPFLWRLGRASRFLYFRFTLNHDVSFLPVDKRRLNSFGDKPSSISPVEGSRQLRLYD